MEVINSVRRVNERIAKNSMIRQIVHFSFLWAMQNLSRRPTFSNGLINTNRTVYIKNNDFAALIVDSIRFLIQQHVHLLNVSAIFCFVW